MFGSQVLETAVGLAFIYLILSTFASTINEAIAAILALRAKDLAAALRNMLAQDALQAAAMAAAAGATPASPVAAGATPSQMGWNVATAVLDYPTIKSLSVQRLFGKAVGPSYLDAKAFATALLDIVAPESGSSFAQVRASISNLQNKQLRSTLLPLVDHAAGDVDQARENIESWYNQVMDRVSGRYKRRAQICLFVIGLVMAFALNIDSIRTVKTLWTDPVVREQLLEQARNAAQNNTPNPSGSRAANSTSGGTPATNPPTSTKAPSDTTKDASPSAPAATSTPVGNANASGAPGAGNSSTEPSDQGANSPGNAAEAKLAVSQAIDAAKQFEGEYSKTATPLGWSLLPPAVYGDDAGWAWAALGWLFTALAISFGAPFWFDFLNNTLKLNARLSGNKPAAK